MLIGLLLTILILDLDLRHFGDRELALLKSYCQLAIVPTFLVMIFVHFRFLGKLRLGSQKLWHWGFASSVLSFCWASEIVFAGRANHLLGTF